MARDHNSANKKSGPTRLGHVQTTSRTGHHVGVPFSPRMHDHLSYAFEYLPITKKNTECEMLTLYKISLAGETHAQANRCFQRTEQPHTRGSSSL